MFYIEMQCALDPHVGDYHRPPLRASVSLRDEALRLHFQGVSPHASQCGRPSGLCSGEHILSIFSPYWLGTWKRRQILSLRLFLSDSHSHWSGRPPAQECAGRKAPISKMNGDCVAPPRKMGLPGRLGHHRADEADRAAMR